MEKLVESASDIALDVRSFREVILSLLDAIPFVTEMWCWRDHKARKIDRRAIEHREHRKDRTLDAITAWFFEPLPVTNGMPHACEELVTYFLNGSLAWSTSHRYPSLSSFWARPIQGSGVGADL